jgi:hypothetical protein
MAGAPLSRPSTNAFRGLEPHGTQQRSSADSPTMRRPTKGYAGRGDHVARAIRALKRESTVPSPKPLLIATF